MSEENIGDGSRITPLNEITGLVYLNDNFTGGELVFGS